MWVLHILYCENVVIRNVVVESFPGANTDGVDVDSSRHVRTSDSYFDTGDDAIRLKSGKDAGGLRVNRPAEDVAITNCTIHRGHGAVVLARRRAESATWSRATSFRREPTGESAPRAPAAVAASSRISGLTTG
ncbi:MAG TPA: glycosyl hydrolase family 28 protein [Bryobacteraceae bacterium]|nr:glycosyl hydrolase family 28 protein [Bryobacteraceae bacterium]